MDERTSHVTKERTNLTNERNEMPVRQTELDQWMERAISQIVHTRPAPICL